MGDYAAKAHDLVKKADKKLNSFGLFGFGSKYEDAAELYEKAANQFKLAKACAPLPRPNFQPPESQKGLQRVLFRLDLYRQMLGMLCFLQGPKQGRLSRSWPRCT